MQEHGQSLVFLITLVIFVFVLFLVYRRKITERFALLWIGISLLLLLASSLGFRYLFKIAQIFGIPYPPSALFLLVIFGLAMLIIELFAWVSTLNERSRVLSQHVALLWDRLEREKGEGKVREVGETVQDTRDEPASSI
ncbi:MAG: DUF2304 domain-containing protein [Acidobacteriia bacterium]|nr:DUF2304 domain-containing protein [Terriglobia bacterium]